MSEKTRWIVRAAMTEYMILMAGALILYLAQQIWPRDTGLIAWVGGIAIAVACIANFFIIFRNAAPSPGSPPKNEP